MPDFRCFFEHEFLHIILRHFPIKFQSVIFLLQQAVEDAAEGIGLLLDEAILILGFDNGCFQKLVDFALV